MGFWNKLGKIALQAAPYVAAPFTGGASLLATGATQKLGQKWAEHDAKKAAEKGMAPSSFDKYLGMASAGAGMASGLGAFGKLAGGGGKVSSGVGSGVSKNSIASVPTGGGGGGWQQALGSLAGGGGSSSGGWGQMLGQIASARGGDSGGGNMPSYGTPPFVPNQTRTAQGPVMPMGGYDWNNNPMNQLDQNMPNLAQSIFQGRQEAMMNQPWRSGYTISPPVDESAPNVPAPAAPGIGPQTMPPIYPQYQPPPQMYGDSLTPQRAARRRHPDEGV